MFYSSCFPYQHVHQNNWHGQDKQHEHYVDSLRVRRPRWSLDEIVLVVQFAQSHGKSFHQSELEELEFLREKDILERVNVALINGQKYEMYLHRTRTKRITLKYWLVSQETAWLFKERPSLGFGQIDAIEQLAKKPRNNSYLRYVVWYWITEGQACLLYTSASCFLGWDCAETWHLEMIFTQRCTTLGTFERGRMHSLCKWLERKAFINLPCYTWAGKTLYRTQPQREKKEAEPGKK